MDKIHVGPVRGADLVTHVGQELALGTVRALGDFLCAAKFRRRQRYLLHFVDALTNREDQEDVLEHHPRAMFK